MLAMVLALAVTQGPVTPAAPMRYRIEAKTASEQDLTSLGRGKLSGSITTTAFVAVTLVDSAAGQIARVAVDSIRLEPTGEMTKSLPVSAAGPVADSARGTYVRAFTAHGAVRSSPQASSPSPALAPVIQAINVLFPGLRSGLKVGDSWADTTNVDTDAQSGHQSGRIIATWKVAGIDISGGFVLDGTATTVMTTTAKGGSIIHQNGTSQEHLVMATRGPTRSATIESTNDISQTAPDHPTPIPAKSVGTLRLTRLP